MKNVIALPSRSAERGFDDNRTLDRFIVESLTEFAVVGVSPDGFIMSWGAGAHRTFGYAEDEIIGRHFSIIFTPEDRAAGVPANELAAARSGDQTNQDRWHVRADATRFWGTNTIQPVYNGSARLLGFAKVVRDTTVSHLAQQNVSASEQRLRLIVESVHEYAIFSVTLDGAIKSWNTGARTIFGYTESEIVGRPLSVLYTADDCATGVCGAQLAEALARGHCTHERWLVRRDLTRFFASAKVSRLERGPDGTRGFVILAHDISERKRVADELRRRAHSDQLTNLPNRAAFFEHVRRAIGSLSRRPTNLFAVLFIDLDHFKAVNEAYGHILADRLLELTARRLERCVRSGDIVARLGGDEFAILLNGINGVADADDAVARISAEMALPLCLDEYRVSLSASIGIALGDGAYAAPEDVLSDADAAMYVAKTSGRARSVLFDPHMREHNRQKRTFETDIRHAIERTELRVAYQPIVDIASHMVVGFEALVRWQHPSRGLLQPDEFIPKAEETDAVIAIDRWVLDVACKQLKTWQLRGGAAAMLQMNVNFSRKQFAHVDLLANLRDTLSASGVEAKYLRIEINPGGIMERSARTAVLLEQIRALGVELQSDDFGLGRTSLESLGRPPAGVLTINRTFIAGMKTASGTAIVGSIAALAHSLSLITIAQGIETTGQLRRLASFECELGQGFLFSGPLDSGAAGDFLGPSSAISKAKKHRVNNDGGLYPRPEG